MRGIVQRVARPVQTHLQNSAVAGQKFINFLSDVESSSVVLMRASMLRSSYPLWNASAHNEFVICQFYPMRAKRRVPYQRPMSNRERNVGLITSTHICTYPKMW